MLYLSNVSSWHCFKISNQKIYKAYSQNYARNMLHNDFFLIHRSMSRVTRWNVPKTSYISFTHYEPSIKMSDMISKVFMNAGFGIKMKTQLKVLKYPDPKLRQDNEIVTEFDESLETLTNNLLNLMYDEEGIGLAAPQVGVNKRIMVFNEEGDPLKKDKEMILINPKIISRSEECNIKDEGCLSFPMIYGKVKRNLVIEIEYQDTKGNSLKTSLKDLPARIFQHEYDHLDKVLFIDHFNEEDKKLNVKRIEKLFKKFGPGGAE